MGVSTQSTWAGIIKHGEDSVETAPLWYEYGDCLLSKEEENPSDDLLGAAAREARAAAQSLGQELRGDDVTSDDVTDEGRYEVDNNDEQNEEIDDLQYAWEALDYARKIYDAHPGENTDLMLAQVYLRTGDHKRFGGFYGQAIEEYKKCMELRTACMMEHDRTLAEVHFMIAITHIYNSGEEDTDCQAEKERALYHYRKAHKILQLGINKSLNSDSEKETKGNFEVDQSQQQEIIEELEETIDSLQSEIEQSISSSSLSSSSLVSTSSNGPISAVGYLDLPSSTVSMTNDSCNFQSTSLSGPTCSANILQPKKKQKN